MDTYYGAMAAEEEFFQAIRIHPIRERNGSKLTGDDDKL